VKIYARAWMGWAIIGILISSVWLNLEIGHLIDDLANGGYHSELELRNWVLLLYAQPVVWLAMFMAIFWLCATSSPKDKDE